MPCTIHQSLLVTAGLFGLPDDLIPEGLKEAFNKVISPDEGESEAGKLQRQYHCDIVHEFMKY